MFFVVDKSRLQRIIAIVREDRTPRNQGHNVPFLCIKAEEDELTISGDKVSATFPATVYESGVLFILTTQFRRILRMTPIKEKFVTFQFTEEGLRFYDVLFPFDIENMIYFPDESKAPEIWPLSSPALEPVFSEKEITQKQLTMFDTENEHNQYAIGHLKYTITDDEWPIIKAAKLMLHKMIRSSEINHKDINSICKVLCVIDRLPETSEELDVSVTLFKPYFENERYHEWEYASWWSILILRKEIRIESYSGYKTPKMKDEAYSWSTLRIGPGWETNERSEYYEPCMGLLPSRVIDDDISLGNYSEEMEGLDWSLKGYSSWIEDNPVEKRK